MSYLPIQDVLSKDFKGKKVQLRGWVYRKRDQKNLIFIVLRDSSDIIQCVVKEGSKVWKEAQKITIESSCTLSGVVHQDKRAPTGYELQVEDLEIVGLAERFPIAKDLSDEFLLDVRHLSIRSRESVAALKVRSTVTEAIHEFYAQKGYFEVQSPTFTASACEGGSTLFPVKYFGKKVYLTQSWQLYAEASIMALERCYCIAPSFRAEKSRTPRHLTEFWQHEMETAWMEFDEMLKIQEECIAYICHKVAKDRADELKFFGRDPEYFASIKTPFSRVTYTEALKKLEKKSIKIKWGDDLGSDEERRLTEDEKEPFFLTYPPVSSKAFYVKEDPRDRKLALSADLLAPEGIGEITTGGQREEDSEVLMQRIKRDKLDPKSFQWYLDLRRFGTVPHSGYGLGVERIVRWLCGLKTIRDAIAFPRTPARCYP